MNAITYDRPEGGWDEFRDEATVALPGRPRRRWLNLKTAALFALVLGAVGFYAGVRVEKSQMPSSSSSLGGLSALGTAAASRSGAGGGAATAATGGTSSAAGAGAGAARRSGSGAGGLSGGFRGLGGGGAAGGGATFGTVSSISGNSIYITDVSGNTIKVTLSGATKVSKSTTVGKKAVRPGDTVVVQGAKGANGTVSASTVSDTGARAAISGGGAGSGGASAGGGNAASAVKSLFGGG